jgi:hypothetical protein
VWTCNAVIVCYSRTGATRTVADPLARTLGCPVVALVDMRPAMGWSTAFTCPFDAWFDRPGAARGAPHDPSRFDLTIVVTPLWDGAPPPATRAYLAAAKAALGSVAFVCTQRAPDVAAAFRQMAQACGREPIATLALDAEAISAPAGAASLAAFAADIAGACAA